MKRAKSRSKYWSNNFKTGMNYLFHSTELSKLDDVRVIIYSFKGEMRFYFWLLSSRKT